MRCDRFSPSRPLPGAHPLPYPPLTPPAVAPPRATCELSTNQRSAEAPRTQKWRIVWRGQGEGRRLPAPGCWLLSYQFWSRRSGSGCEGCSLRWVWARWSVACYADGWYWLICKECAMSNRRCVQNPTIWVRDGSGNVITEHRTSVRCFDSSKAMMQRAHHHKLVPGMWSTVTRYQFDVRGEVGYKFDYLSSCVVWWSLPAGCIIDPTYIYESSVTAWALSAMHGLGQGDNYWLVHFWCLGTD